ncbi:hypothetical protein ACN2C6_16530 [Caulobacter sp. ErkDOM-YI]|uniref:hypothetical protein n=1 Tax=unclassified Caulobacter TaxID=2648921 RepID=UPI003AF9E933
MDPILESALRRREFLKSELVRIQEDLEKIEEFIRIGVRLAEDSAPQTLLLPLDPPSLDAEKSPKMGDGVHKSSEMEAVPHSPRRPRTRANPKPAVVMSEVLKILGEVDQPQTRSELLSTLRERGIHIDGHDPAKVLGTNIWRFMNRTNTIAQSGEGYWLADRPLPE